MAALLVAILLALPAGVHSAQRATDGTTGDQRGQFVWAVVPELRAGADSDSDFSIALGWLPVSGRDRSIIWCFRPSPWRCAGAILTRMVRTSMLEELSQDYVRTARAKDYPRM